MQHRRPGDGSGGGAGQRGPGRLAARIAGVRCQGAQTPIVLSFAFQPQQAESMIKSCLACMSGYKIVLTSNKWTDAMDGDLPHT